MALGKKNYEPFFHGLRKVFVRIFFCLFTFVFAAIEVMWRYEIVAVFVVCEKKYGEVVAFNIKLLL